MARSADWITHKVPFSPHYRTYLDYWDVRNKAMSPGRNDNDAYHKPFMEIRTKQILVRISGEYHKRAIGCAYVNEFLALLLFCSPSLIFKNNIVVPASFNVEILRVE